MEQSAQKTTLLFLFAIILVILAAVVGYYFGLQEGIKKQPSKSQPTQAKVLRGFQKADELTRSFPDIILRSGAQLVYAGVLTNIGPGNRWTIEREGKTVTIIHETQEEIKYSRISEGSTQQIEAVDLRIGDKVAITTFINPDTGFVSVKSIVAQP